MSARTSECSASNAFRRCEPTYPAAPVTKIFFIEGSYEYVFIKIWGFYRQLSSLQKSLYTMADYIVAMATTIQVSKQLANTLKKRRQYDKESYEEVIWNLVEDTMEINAEAKKEVVAARADTKAGKFYTHDQVKKRLGM